MRASSPVGVDDPLLGHVAEPAEGIPARAVEGRGGVGRPHRRQAHLLDDIVGIEPLPQARRHPLGDEGHQPGTMRLDAGRHGAGIAPPDRFFVFARLHARHATVVVRTGGIIRDCPRLVGVRHRRRPPPRA